MRINEPRQDRCAWVMHLLGARRPWKSGSGTHIAQTPRFNQHSAVFDWDRPRSVDQPIRPKYERTVGGRAHRESSDSSSRAGGALKSGLWNGDSRCSMDALELPT